MPCCTYLNGDEGLAPTSDKEINALLADVRAATGEDWRVREYRYEHRRWFRKPRIVCDYELYHCVHGPEYQIINFYRPDRTDDSSLNFYNDAGYVVAYLYGVLAGVQQSKTTP